MDGKVNDDFVRLLVVDGSLKHPSDVVVSLFEAVEGGNVLWADHLTDGYAVDQDSVNDRVEQELSFFLISLLYIFRELVERCLVIFEDPYEVATERSKDRCALSHVFLIMLLDFSHIFEVDGDVDILVDLHDIWAVVALQVIPLEHGESHYVVTPLAKALL